MIQEELQTIEHLTGVKSNQIRSSDDGFWSRGYIIDNGSDVLREEMLRAYGADSVLREKVKLRVLLRPLFVLGDYVKRGDAKRVELLVKRIKDLLEKNYDTI